MSQADRPRSSGLTPKAVPSFRDVIAALRDMDRSLTKLMKQRDELRQKTTPSEQELRHRLVPYGASGRLALAEEVAVLPLDDDELLDKSNPVRPDGKVKLDAERIEVRHDAQVKAAIDSGPCSLLVLGGSHDLSASVRRVGGGTVEYVRVTTARFKEVAKAR